MQIFIPSYLLGDNVSNACRIIVVILSAKTILMLLSATVVQLVVLLELVEENYALKTLKLYQ